MAYQPMDAFQCFTSISENVPSWIRRVTELAAHTAKKHAEFSEEYKKLAHIKPQQRRRKNSSVHSIRPSSELGAQDGAVSSFQNPRGSFIKIIQSPPTGSKRNVTDAASIASSQILRAQRQLVIHYDVHTQKELEQVVRDIGAARNSIRKGKMSQVMRRPNLTMEMFSSRSRDSPRAPQLSGDSMIRMQAQAPQENQPVSSFDFTDKQLETAQSLCETAAHQFLRCGDCSAQLETILAKFNLVLETAKKEVHRLNAEKEADSDDEMAETETTPQVALKPVDASEDGKSPDPGSAAIEVDDTPSDSSVSIDITAFRSSRFRV